MFQVDAQGKEVKKNCKALLAAKKVEQLRSNRKKKDKTHLCVNQNDAKTSTYHQKRVVLMLKSNFCGNSVNNSKRLKFEF